MLSLENRWHHPETNLKKDKEPFRVHLSGVALNSQLSAPENATPLRKRAYEAFNLDGTVHHQSDQHRSLLVRSNLKMPVTTGCRSHLSDKQESVA